CNADKATHLGVVTADLGFITNALIYDGAYVGDFWLDGKKVDLVITGDESLAQHTQEVGNLQISTPTGDVVPLRAVADIKMGSSPEQINRIERERAITIQVKPGPGIPLEE